jgi:hypothetical protein
MAALATQGLTPPTGLYSYSTRAAALRQGADAPQLLTPGRATRAGRTGRLGRLGPTLFKTESDPVLSEAGPAAAEEEFRHTRYPGPGPGRIERADDADEIGAIRWRRERERIGAIRWVAK